LQSISLGISIYCCVDTRDLFIIPEFIETILGINIFSFSTASSLVICYYWHLVLNSSDIIVMDVNKVFLKGFFVLAGIVVLYTLVFDVVYLVEKNNRTFITTILGALTVVIGVAISIFYIVTANNLIKKLSEFQTTTKEQVKRITAVMAITIVGFLIYVVVLLSYATGFYLFNVPGSVFNKILVRLCPIFIYFTQAIWLWDNFYRKRKGTKKTTSKTAKTKTATVTRTHTSDGSKNTAKDNESESEIVDENINDVDDDDNVVSESSDD